LKPLIKKNLPVKLADMAWDRVESHFPISYQRHAIASTLASTMVYAEGIHFVEAQAVDKKKLAKTAFKYYDAMIQINELSESLKSKGDEIGALEDEEVKKVLKLLKDGGVRTLLGIY
jgi:Ca2+-binding EF-hand superfamily protein